MFCWCCSIRCHCLRAGNTPATPTWWRTSASPSSVHPGRLARRRTSSTQITWPTRHRSARTMSTAEPPTCRSGMAAAAAGGGPTPTPHTRSLSKRSDDDMAWRRHWRTGLPLSHYSSSTRIQNQALFPGSSLASRGTGSDSERPQEVKPV